MFVRLIVAAVLVIVAVGVARLIQSRRGLDPPTQRRLDFPRQLDRADFASPDTPWLLVVFTSDTCSTCADVVNKAEVVTSESVVVDVVSFQQQRAVHERYDIDAVPLTLIVDPDGVVAFGHAGPITATDLWAEVATARE